MKLSKNVGSVFLANLVAMSLVVGACAGKKDKDEKKATTSTPNNNATAHAAVVADLKRAIDAQKKTNETLAADHKKVLVKARKSKNRAVEKARKEKGKDIQKDLDDIAEKTKLNDEAIAKANTARDSWKEKFETLKGLEGVLKTEIDKLQELLDSGSTDHAEILKLLGDVLAGKKDIEVLGQQLLGKMDQKDQSIAVLEKGQSDVRGDVRQMQEQLGTLTGRIDALETDVAKLKTDIENAQTPQDLTDSQNNLETVKVDLESQITVVRDRVDGQEKAVAAAVEKSENLSAEITKIQEEITAIKKEAVASGDMSGQKEKLEELAKKFGELESGLADLSGKVAEIEKKNGKPIVDADTATDVSAAAAPVSDEKEKEDKKEDENSSDEEIQAAASLVEKLRSKERKDLIDNELKPEIAITDELIKEKKDKSKKQKKRRGDILKALRDVDEDTDKVTSDVAKVAEENPAFVNALKEMVDGRQKFLTELEIGELKDKELSFLLVVAGGTTQANSQKVKDLLAKKTEIRIVGRYFFPENSSQMSAEAAVDQSERLFRQRYLVNAKYSDLKAVKAEIKLIAPFISPVIVPIRGVRTDSYVRIEKTLKEASDVNVILATAHKVGEQILSEEELTALLTDPAAQLGQKAACENFTANCADALTDANAKLVDRTDTASVLAKSAHVSLESAVCSSVKAAKALEEVAKGTEKVVNLHDIITRLSLTSISYAADTSKIAGVVAMAAAKLTTDDPSKYTADDIQALVSLKSKDASLATPTLLLVSLPSQLESIANPIEEIAGILNKESAEKALKALQDAGMIEIVNKLAEKLGCAKEEVAQEGDEEEFVEGVQKQTKQESDEEEFVE